MAEEQLNIKLGEFVQNCADDLASGSLTPEETYVVMRQYKSLRELVDGKNEEIARKIAEGEDFKNILIELLSGVGHREKHVELPEETRPPAEVAARAQAFAKARQQTEQAIPETLKQRRKNYARQVTSAWVSELRSRRLYAKPEEIEKKISSAVEKIPPGATPQETRAALAQSFQALTREDSTLTPYQTALGAATQTIEPPTAFSIRQETTRAILDNPETTRPDVLMQLVGQGIDATKAASLTRFSEAFSADINPAIDITRPMKFFQSVTEAGWKKPLAVAADAFLTVLPQETREAVIESVLSKSWGRVTTNLDQLSQQFGTAVVQSEFFQNAIARGNEAFATKRASGGAVAGISNFFGDALDTVFKGEIDQAVIEKYLGLERKTGVSAGSVVTEINVVQHPAWHHFYAGLVHAHDPLIFSFSFDGIRRILGFGTGKIATGAAGKAVGVAAKGGLGKIIGGLLGGVATGPLAPIGAIVGSLLGDKILGGLWRGAKSLFNTFFGGGLITRLFSGGTGRWQDDFPLIITVVVLAPIILVFIFPSFLNPQFVGNTSQESALVDFGKELAGPPGVVGNISFDPNTCGANLVARGQEIANSLVNPPGSSLHGIWNYWNYSSLYPNIWTSSTYQLLKNDPYCDYLTECRVPNIFWCTHMITKSYERAGESMPQNLLAVWGMANYFQAQGRYVRNGTVPIKSLPVGTVVFYAVGSVRGHVSLITSIDQDYVSIVQSNSGTKTKTHSISTNGNNLQSGIGTMPITGFGLPPCAAVNKL